MSVTRGWLPFAVRDRIAHRLGASVLVTGRRVSRCSTRRRTARDRRITLRNALVPFKPREAFVDLLKRQLSKRIERIVCKIAFHDDRILDCPDER